MSTVEKESLSASKYESVETREWLESLDYVIADGGGERARRLLHRLQIHAQKSGVSIPFSANTPYLNTIPTSQQAPFPGSREIERRIKSLNRWNAMAMVVKANDELAGIGGHIATYASAATMYEIGFHHFFRGHDAPGGGDQIFFQGHASPGIYARAFLEGRLTEGQLERFRRELAPEGGLSSYPHPWLMPNFWEFPTVSMGLGPIMAIYQARFNRYLADRNIKDTSGGRVWAFLGDGETDEPESLGAISLAARERLDNLIFVVNCNLQRLDGPVRGNGKIIQELERIFRGAGWNVIKVVWGSAWDRLLDMDDEGHLAAKLEATLDGEWQRYSAAGAEVFRQEFFLGDSKLRHIGEAVPLSHFERLRRGGHDPEKVYAAYKAATENDGSPSVILCKTVKGYGLGAAGEAKNITHQQKKLNQEQLVYFRNRFDIPLSEEQAEVATLYRPREDSREVQYVLERRKELGGPLPLRQENAEALPVPDSKLFAEFGKGTNGREVSTTMVLVRMLSKLLRDPAVGKRIVPIIPDEARTFGMEGLFSQFGIYSHRGQLYEPVDAGSVMYYKEAKDGQILEEGITEAGAMSSFIAAGTAYSSHGVQMIPFYIFYSMFGLQRIGDLAWAAGDMRCQGFLIGGTAGRTTLAGEGLQHQDGNSHLLAYPLPTMMAYDPAFAFELAVIVRDGLRRMYEKQEKIFYYITVENENYAMPPMPTGAEEGILKGLYRFRKSAASKKGHKVQLFGSGAILNEALRAQDLLAQDYGVEADVWSITSYKALHREASEADRWNRLHPTQKPRLSYLEKSLAGAEGPLIFASDYVKALPYSLSKWLPRNPSCLGTDGFGRSDGRAALRSFFEVDYRHITFAALSELAREGGIKTRVIQQARQALEINPDETDPIYR